MANKKIAIMQPYLFPYVGYFQLINAVDIFVFHDDIQWIKGGWINSHTIWSKNGELKVSLPVSKHSSFSNIDEVNLVPDIKSRIKYLNIIKQTYLKSPHFLTIFPLVEKIIMKQEENVAKFVENSFLELLPLLGLKPKIMYTRLMNNDKSLKGEEKVIDICKCVEGTNYINTINGKHLYDKEHFFSHNIVLNFLDREIEPYKQFGNEFVPYLSIIDLLMFNDIETVQKMITKGKLV
ncbi:putative uncharacterized protein [Azospirillum sp. CAG:260]|jgi:WbqC-like protein|uniref:WbqC family protein n=1 Tax=Phocaeicola sp. TaxID=2773926 RepID=UPI00033A038F|nr:putative uncharacterized protein [Azospirillum sp. CAG:260]